MSTLYTAPDHCEPISLGHTINNMEVIKHKKHFKNYKYRSISTKRTEIHMKKSNGYFATERTSDDLLTKRSFSIF